jgi:hypothetical protein
MRVLSIHLARAVAFMELGELNLKGKVFFPDIVQSIGERYRFISNNSKDKDSLNENGLIFESGYWDGTIIKKLSFAPTLTVLDTNSSTDESQRILAEILGWATKELGANFSPDLIRRWAFVSDIIIQTDFPLLFGQNSVLESISQKVAQAVHDNLRENLDFQPSALSIGHDPQKRSTVIAPFSINHRANTLFEDNIFFAEAPVPTDVHLGLLEELEAAFRKNYESLHRLRAAD